LDRTSHPGTPSRRISRTLRKLAPNPIDLYEPRFRQKVWVSPAREEGPFIDYLNALLLTVNPAHVAMGAPVTRFVLRNRERLFPSSPLLIRNLDVRTYEDLCTHA